LGEGESSRELFPEAVPLPEAGPPAPWPLPLPLPLASSSTTMLVLVPRRSRIGGDAVEMLARLGCLNGVPLEEVAAPAPGGSQPAPAAAAPPGWSTSWLGEESPPPSGLPLKSPLPFTVGTV